MEDPDTNEIRLPAELLKEIFVKVKNKKDLVNCLLVCKTWYFTVHTLFSQDIRIVMNRRTVDRLQKDLQAYPAIGEKVKHIKFDQLSVAESPTILRNALNLCPNLLELQFDITDVYEYLKAMNCHEMILPSIQKIRVSDLNSSSPAVRRFHLWVNYRFRATITSLEIADLEENGALKNYGGLADLVSQFPNLTYLKAKCHSRGERQLTVDLTALLRAAPKLQELKLYDIGQITNDIKDLLESEAVEYTNLTKLKLKVSQISIKSLQYITKRFKNLNNLRLQALTVTADNSLTTPEENIILDEFEAYCESFERLNVSYHYKARDFYKNNGKKRPNFTMLVGLPEELFLLDDDDLWMMEQEMFDDFDEEEEFFFDDVYQDFLEHQQSVDDDDDLDDHMDDGEFLVSLFYQQQLAEQEAEDEEEQEEMHLQHQIEAQEEQDFEDMLYQQQVQDDQDVLNEILHEEMIQKQQIDEALEEEEFEDMLYQQHMQGAQEAREENDMLCQHQKLEDEDCDVECEDMHLQDETDKEVEMQHQRQMEDERNHLDKDCDIEYKNMLYQERLQDEANEEAEMCYQQQLEVVRIYEEAGDMFYHDPFGMDDHMEETMIGNF